MELSETSPQLTFDLFSEPAAAEPETQRTLLDVPGLASRLGVTTRFVRRLVAERRVPFLKIGKFVRFDPLEIAAWVDTQRVQPD